MTTSDPATITDLDNALTRLTDVELQTFVVRMHGLANNFLDDDEMRVADLFAALCVLGAEQQDRRRELAEHARVQIEGDEVGALLSAAQDLEPTAVPPDPADADERVGWLVPWRIFRTALEVVQHLRHDNPEALEPALAEIRDDGDDGFHLVITLANYVNAALDARPGNPDQWLNEAAAYVASMESDDVPPAA